MKRYFLLIISFIFLAGPAASSKETPLERLREGDVVTDGGPLDKGVWATMEGIVDAPPEAVWQLFIRANEWKGYKLPHLIDCRAVDETMLNGVRDRKKVEEVYDVLGNRVVDPLAPRKERSEWTNYTFQYFNMPWPVADRWYILQNFADETKSQDGIYVTHWQSHAGNVRSVKGELRLEPFEGTAKTHLTYRAEVDLGSTIPRFLLKYGVKKSLPESMKVIRRESARLSREHP